MDDRPKFKSKILEENVRVSVYNLGLGNGFLDRTQKLPIKKENKKNWTSSELKSFAL